MFRPGVNAGSRIVPNIKLAKQLYPQDTGFLAFLDQERSTYDQYAGKLFAVGVAETDAYFENDRWWAPITRLQLLDSPIPYDDLKLIKKVNPAGTVTRLDQQSYEKIAALIINRNPNLEMDELRASAIRNVVEEIQKAYDEEINAGADVAISLPQNDRDTNSMDHPTVTHKTSEQYARDQKLVQKLKTLYQCRCQLCQNYFDIPMDSGTNYVEVHHIIPNSVGYDEEGNSVDNPGNMIVVCPNHHRYLHYHKGGPYKLEVIGGDLYLSNLLDKVQIIRDLHLKGFMS